MSEAEKGYYVRFSPYHRISHFIMMTTFIMCALTGPPLKYSYDFWAQGLMSFWGGVENAGLIHRISAGFMVGDFVVHAVFLAFCIVVRKQKITGPNSIWFWKKDLLDFIAMFKWFFDRGERPRLERFTFWEKFDYWAVLNLSSVVGVLVLLALSVSGCTSRYGEQTVSTDTQGLESTISEAERR